jgi:hypothetical protein
MSGAIDWDGPCRQICPECGRGPKDRTLGVTVEQDGHGVAHCFRCEYVEARRGDDSRKVRPAKDRKVEVDDADAVARKIALAAGILPCTRTIATVPESPAWLYLHRSRSCVIPPADSDLRWHADLRLFGFSGPALVGRMSLALDRREFRGLHLTWLGFDGIMWQRAERRYLGPKAGCVVRLWPDEAVSTGLCVGEGIETCLSVAHHFTPVWACLDAGNLSKFPMLPGIECLTIATDHDPAGIAAATACATRWADAGVNAAAIAPRTARHDWNDERAAA